jgi:hypothetical protein
VPSRLVSHGTALATTIPKKVSWEPVNVNREMRASYLQE